jgi:hypothetical protein
MHVLLLLEAKFVDWLNRCGSLVRGPCWPHSDNPVSQDLAQVYKVNDSATPSGYPSFMNFEPLIRLCQTVGSTSRAAGSYKPR